MKFPTIFLNPPDTAAPTQLLKRFSIPANRELHSYLVVQTTSVRGLVLHLDDEVMLVSRDGRLTGCWAGQ